MRDFWDFLGYVWSPCCFGSIVPSLSAISILRYCTDTVQYHLVLQRDLTSTGRTEVRTLRILLLGWICPLLTIVGITTVLPVDLRGVRRIFQASGPILDSEAALLSPRALAR